jgi:hypothetical protein
MIQFIIGALKRENKSKVFCEWKVNAKGTSKYDRFDQKRLDE